MIKHNLKWLSIVLAVWVRYFVYFSSSFFWPWNWLKAIWLSQVIKFKETFFFFLKCYLETSRQTLFSCSITTIVKSVLFTLLTVYLHTFYRCPTNQNFIASYFFISFCVFHVLRYLSVLLSLYENFVSGMCFQFHYLLLIILDLCRMQRIRWSLQILKLINLQVLLTYGSLVFYFPLSLAKRNLFWVPCRVDKELKICFFSRDLRGSLTTCSSEYIIHSIFICIIRYFGISDRLCAIMPITGDQYGRLTLRLYDKMSCLGQ